MATHRNRFIKVALFEECKTHLQDSKVVGQGSDYLLLERAAPKARAAATTPRKRKTNAKATPTSTAQEQVHGA